MQSKDYKLFSPFRLRKAAWLALVALAFLQLSIAGHQFDHSLSSVTDTCDLCVQLDRMDDGMAGHAASQFTYFGVPTQIPLVSTLTVDDVCVHGFNPRAPPQSLI